MKRLWQKGDWGADLARPMGVFSPGFAAIETCGLVQSDPPRSACMAGKAVTYALVEF